ncbi:sigma-70 family RNA polymerase sigma factor [Sutcliffiella horikoshii]|uniref:sigma-70 family RNA polymerase sigma factor n=1 Tax=Sutcliffiella horikoshii TaxID=79883 RepID=UPI0009EE8743|nr:sigma-70 family RNA polymerase sigma factor [Sutcliffiella horikoshii]MCM3618810.1 sigma-70 family RNA polymerase sigma factor [Sutcliffiella horikoshii]
MARENELSEEKREEMVVWAMDHHGEEIKRLIYTYVRNYAVVDDLSQEVFVKVYKNLHVFRGDSEFKTWIYRIAINSCKDYLRSFKHKVQQLVQPLLASGEQTEAMVLMSEERQELASIVMNLPLKYREAIILHYYRDFSVEEISELLEVNKNTVKTRLKRGRDKVRDYIMEGSGEYGQESSTRKRSL